MKSQTKSLLLLCAVVGIGLVPVAQGQTAQPLKVNWICATGDPCAGGFQSASRDSDTGQVVLHFTVIPGTPDGSYGWSYTVDGIGGGSYSVTVTGGQVIYNQDWIIYQQTGQDYRPISRRNF